MPEPRRRRAVLVWTSLPLLLAVAVVPTTVAAQTGSHPGWAVVPLLGFGVARDGDWGSAGMEAAVELEYGGPDWRWSGYGSVRGLGVGCSHACFDGGPAVALGGTRSIGPLRVGGGAGVMKQFGEWRLLPYGRISLDATPLRFDMRIELPQGSGSGVYLPVLIGIPISG